MTKRVTFIEGLITDAFVVYIDYEAIVSNSLLHHLHKPNLLWDLIVEHSLQGTIIFVADLFRPRSRQEAERLVNAHMGGEPEILTRDFFNFLMATFEPVQVEAQPSEAGLTELRIRTVSDIHLLVYGRRGG